MKIDDQTLMAFVDGQLERAAVVEVEKALAADAQLADRVARLRAVNRRLRAAFDPVLEEPVPDRLAALLRAPAAAGRDARVANLDRARVARKTADTAPRRWSWPEWRAMAASLLVGCAVGYLGLRMLPAGPLAERDGRVIAEGSLANALAAHTAALDVPHGAPRIGLSYVARSGAYCRTFSFGTASASTGLACNENGQWNVLLLTKGARSSDASNNYRTAGSELPKALQDAVDASIGDQPPLDAAAEQAAIRSGWRK